MSFFNRGGWCPWSFPKIFGEFLFIFCKTIFSHTWATGLRLGLRLQCAPKTAFAVRYEAHQATTLRRQTVYFYGRPGLTLAGLEGFKIHNSSVAALGTASFSR